MRIDYLWTSAKPLAATLFSKKTSDGTSFRCARRFQGPSSL